MNDAITKALDSSLVKVKRGVRTKKILQFEEIEEGISRSNSQYTGKKSPTNLTIGFDMDHTALATMGPIVNNTSSISIRKGKRLKGSTSTTTAGSLTDNTFSTPTNKDAKLDALKRLALMKPPKDNLKDSKKIIVREIEVNFFDPSLSQQINELVDSILERSQSVRELLQKNSIGNQFVNNEVVNDPHFGICLKTLLDQLYKQNEISYDLKVVNKSALTKLEKFVFEKIEFRLKFLSLEEAIENQYKEIEKINNDRTTQLMSQMSG